MIKRTIVFLVFLLCFVATSIAQTQLKAFSEDHVLFMDELKDFFDKSQNKSEADDFIREFEKFMKLQKLTAVQTSAMYKTCNLMLKKRLRPLPDFKQYLTCLMNFANSTQSEKNFIAWQSAVEKIMNGKAIKNLSDYLSMSESLFFSNSFYKSPTYEWSSNNSDYEFAYDTVPKVIFSSLNLSCYNSKSDSTVINNTKGVYYPFEGKFIGVGGKVDWSRTGLDPNIVYAEIKKYTVICKAGGYTADSVIFYHKQYFQKPLLGILNEKMISEDKKLVSFPRFESYDKRLQINELAPGIDYDGGFSMRGSKFIGAGSKEEDAYIRIKRNDKYFIIVGSKLFAITKEKLLSDKANITILLDKDTISHPGLVFNYLIANNQLSLIRNEDGLSKTPYFNTFHEVDMYFEELYWKTDEPKMDFKMMIGSTQGEADFESSNYYKQDRYDRLQGMESMHPLIKIRDYVKSLNGYRKTSVVDLAKYMRITADQLRPFLARIANMGLLAYDTEDDEIEVKDRLIAYVTNRAGKTDYDVLSFHSVIPGQANASLNLLNYDLTIRGVETILLSDSQNVYIYPKNKEIVLKKNRYFTFSGIVNAGRFEYFGKEFSFDYEKFKLNLNNVDSLKIKVQSNEPNERGEYPLVRVKTVVENITGDLLIDNPANKSGVKSFPKYPIFNSFKESFVYYDKRNSQGNVYRRDNFYFKLEPFTIDSLDNFTNKSLDFKGDFVSAGIFPQFKESLKLQPDYSLGFVRPTPPDGFVLYGGTAKFNNTINLSNKGLRGDGDISYVTSTTKSNDILFFPDSLNANAQIFDVKEQKAKVEFPQVKGENVYVHYMPKKDFMEVSNKQTPFSSYNGQAEFRGLYTLTPDLLSGNGKASFSGAELESNNIEFKQITFDADTSDFRLKSKDVDVNGLAFSTRNVKAHIDFSGRFGEFVSNGKGSVVNFPVNQYMCFMDKFKWYMDKSDIELGSDKKTKDAEADVELSGSEFISTHPKQDSLRFIAPYAKYDLKKYIISAQDVKYINVADARVFPDSGKVVIERNAVMKTLTNAKIQANNVTKYHNIYNATVNIYAKKSYAGSGYYDYIDESKKKTSLYFSNVSVDTTYQTIASTEISDTSKFMLSPQYAYKGKVKLFATNQFLTFSGAIQIQHTCDKITRDWLRFTSEINADQIYVPIVDDLLDYDGSKMASSIMITNDSATHVYSAFVSKKKLKSDNEILPAKGFLFFDKASQEYRISNKEKLVERSIPGNYLSLNTKNCVVAGEGKLDFGVDLGQVSLKPVGNATNYTIPDSTIFELMLGINFFFDDNAIGKMADEIGIYFTNLQATDFSRPNYEKGLRELIGKEEADKLISQVNLYGSFKKFPDALKHTILFNELKMKWNPETKSYLSVGEIGIGSINKNQVNKYVDGRIEIVRKKGGDIINVYLELDGSNWYFFNYTRGLMQAISSNESFNNIIKELKSDKRQVKVEKGQAPYQFNLSTIRKKNDFVRKTQGLEEEKQEQEK